MNLRTVVRIQEFADGKSVFSLESPKGYPEAGKVRQLQSLSGEHPFIDMHTGDGSPNWVMEAGRKLFDDLSMHPAVGPAITQALLEVHGGCSPIYLRMDDVTAAEELPWESVCRGSSEFLSLDDRWPIVRVREAKEADPRLLYDFEPPLRITAVLSAAGNDDQTRAPALPQWKAIYEAILLGLTAANAIPIALTVLLGEKSLLQQIQGLQQPWIQCGYITDKEGLLQKIKDSQPNLLHFFCHGTSEEIPHLQIGSYTDWEAGRGGTVAVTAVELRQLADPKQGIWLVTLNCCESATQARDGRGLASSLVAAGFPAALGMREKIDVQLAHTVCQAFYPALLDLIAKAVPDGPNRDIEWAQALSKVRSKLAGEGRNGQTAQEAARSCKTWTIPALYTRREPFVLKRILPQGVAPPGLSEAKKRQIDYIQELQRQRTKAAEDYKDLPPDALRAILDDFDAQLARATLRLKQTN
jgi:CHAT domain